MGKIYSGRDGTARPGAEDMLDVVVVGAGFAGLYGLHLYRKLGFRTLLVEAGTGVGGVWYWNRYPGARCDVESVQYSFSFDEDLYRSWTWTERFASQPEILAYLNYVADRLDLRRDIRLNTRVAAMQFVEAGSRWLLEMQDGSTASARFCVMATGPLSASQLPEIPGIGQFGGLALHSARWPKEPLDLAGSRVGVIGTGSTGIQIIQEVAKTAGALTVFQRTANFCVRLGNAPLAPEQIAYWKENLNELKEDARTNNARGVVADVGTISALAVDDATRNAEFERRWQIGGSEFMLSYTDLTRNLEANRHAADFVRNKIAATVLDPEVAEKLTPRDLPIGSKRIALSDEYYDVFNRPNVELVDIRANPITSIDRDGINCGSLHYPLDKIVFATGFDALTGALNRIDVRGRSGLSLREAWSRNPIAHLGLMMPGFPNLFIVNGPGSPSVLTNVVVSIEHHIEWIAACLQHMRDRGQASAEPTGEARQGWSETVEKAGSETVYMEAESWYVGANVPGKPRVFLPYVGGHHNYRRLCDAVIRNGFPGFVFFQPSRPPNLPERQNEFLKSR